MAARVPSPPSISRATSPKVPPVRWGTSSSGLVKHVAQAFDAEVAFVAEVIPEDRERARFLACPSGPSRGPVRDMEHT
jgi:hypothetical protein